MKLKFLQDGFVNGQCVFKAGQTYEVDNTHGSADRWIRRGALPVVEKEMIVLPVSKLQEDVEKATQVEQTDIEVGKASKKAKAKFKRDADIEL
jgi:hypothetical protein